MDNTKYQIEKYDAIYQKYIFVTRWRSFEHLPYNRILPTEDFDVAVREQRVFKEEVKASKRKEAKNKHVDLSAETQTSVYVPQLSSLLLWALCPNDTSSVWLRLFDSEHFAEAYSDRNKYREILNQDD